MNPDNNTWWRRRSVRLWAGLLAVAVVATGVVVHHQQTKDRLAAGASRTGEYSMSDGYRSAGIDFTVPNAQVRVSIELGRKGIRTHNDKLQTVRAPGGGLLAHLSWTSTSTAADGSDAGTRPSRLRVRSGDTAVVVDPSLSPDPASAADTDDEKEQKIVALPGKLSDVVVEVEFAGRTQAVQVIDGRREPGDFAGLYRTAVYLGGTQPVSIQQSQPTDPKSPFRWSGSASAGRALRLPYVEGLGWAPVGREWVLVRGAGYTMDTTDAVSWSTADAYARYSPTGTPVVAVTLDGRAPVKFLGKMGVRTSYDFQTGSRDCVFSVPTGNAFSIETVVRTKVHRTSGDATAPASSTMQLRDNDSYPAAVDPTSGNRR